MNLEDFIEMLKGEFSEKEQEQVKAEKSFREMDSWNSMMALIVIAKIDNEYDVTLTADEISQAVTFHDLYQLTAEKKDFRS